MGWFSGVFAAVLSHQGGDSNKDASTNTVTGNETITASGGIYMPCGTLTMLNGAEIETASASTAKVEANKIVVNGGAKLNITGAGAPAAANVSLLQ